MAIQYTNVEGKYRYQPERVDGRVLVIDRGYSYDSWNHLYMDPIESKGERPVLYRKRKAERVERRANKAYRKARANIYWEA